MDFDLKRIVIYQRFEKKIEQAFEAEAHIITGQIHGGFKLCDIARLQVFHKLQGYYYKFIKVNTLHSYHFIHLLVTSLTSCQATSLSNYQDTRLLSY